MALRGNLDLHLQLLLTRSTFLSLDWKAELKRAPLLSFVPMDFVLARYKQFHFQRRADGSTAATRALLPVSIRLWRLPVLDLAGAPV